MATLEQLGAKIGDTVFLVEAHKEVSRTLMIGKRVIRISPVPFDDPGVVVTLDVGKVLDTHRVNAAGFPVIGIEALQRGEWIETGEVHDVDGGYEGFVDDSMRRELGRAGFSIEPRIDQAGVTSFELVRTPHP